MDIWFTSDLHLGHGSILDFQGRPYSDIEEMNNALIASVNRRAKAGDILYILGDVAYRNAGGFPAAVEMVAGLRCKKKRLVLGNHDAAYANRWERSGLFESVSRFEELAARGFGYEADMTLCHYPLLQWNRSRHNGKEGSMPSIMVCFVKRSFSFSSPLSFGCHHVNLSGFVKGIPSRHIRLRTRRQIASVRLVLASSMRIPRSSPGTRASRPRGSSPLPRTGLALLSCTWSRCIPRTSRRARRAPFPPRAGA